MQSMQNTALKNRLDSYKEENPKARLVEIAKALNISEMEALHCQLDNETVVALKADWKRLFAALPDLGPIMALTRNDYVVHECKGRFAPTSWQGPMGLVQGDNIDLRMFSSRWTYLFAVQVKNPRGLLHSLQIFDDTGRAVQKIYLEKGADLNAYFNLLQELKQERLDLPEQLASRPAPEQARAIDEVEIENFRKDWAALQDTHEFFGMLRKHRVPRLQAMEIAGPEFVREVRRESVVQLLEEAREKAEPLMAFVGNPGMIQIYSGPVKNTKRMGDWMNVLDPTFNLHVDERGIDRVFIVHKPTRYGLVSSLEVFSAQGELILSLFGYRKDDSQQAPGWGQLLASLRLS
ncbi:hemin-degrading factor [Oligoflexus tunisiensis]|uniref:hemin-degrading factor n=1 Tax=Oligoflexus tunisiensis TaxID=708132 RepID=UPI000AE3A335|nr:ChuX/HutX family heme-like substrate-binding protein [Oligoflexus tunisiensis]